MDHFLEWLRGANCQVTFLPRYVAYHHLFGQLILTNFSLPAPLLVAPPSNELTVCRLVYRTLPLGRSLQRNSRTTPGVEPLLIIETVLDDNVTTESGPIEIVLNPAPGNNTICRHGYETSVDLILPDR